MKKSFIVQGVKDELPQSVVDAVDDVIDETRYLSAQVPPVVIVDTIDEQYVIMTRDEFEAWFGVIDE